MWTGQGQKRDDACDIVVVGAGLVGAAAAARLTREGFETAVLEAQSVAGGATGRSAGMALTGLAAHYNWAVSAYGRQKAREIWSLTAEGRERLIETARRLRVPVEQTGSLALAVEDAEVDALKESAELLREDGFDAWFSSTDPLERGFRAALRQPNDATVDGAALARSLLAADDVIVHEETEVHKLEPAGDYVRVWARGRTVLCSAVVLAVNGYAPLIDAYFADKVAPIRSLVFATEPLNGTVLERPCYADYGYEYCRQLPDRRLLLGAWRRRSASNQETDLDDVVQEGLIRLASRHFPEVDPRHVTRWSGVMGFTSDNLPLVGALPHLPRVYFAVGFGGRGLTWAFVAAERLVNLMLRDTDVGLLSADRLDNVKLLV